MAAEADDGKRKESLKEIQELYDRLGISRGKDEPPRSFDEYAWKYGFTPEAKRHGTTRDPHTRLSR